MEGAKVGENGKMVVHSETPGEEITEDFSDGEQGDEEIPEYSAVELLAAEEDFPEWVVAAAEAARVKNEAEKKYKAIKQKIIKLMLKAKVENVTCVGYRLGLYKGHHVTLDEKKLLEAGVAADLSVKGGRDTTFDDVRIMAPK